jgi:hypothetical protein
MPLQDGAFARSLCVFGHNGVVGIELRHAVSLVDKADASFATHADVIPRVLSVRARQMNDADVQDAMPAVVDDPRARIASA